MIMDSFIIRFIKSCLSGIRRFAVKESESSFFVNYFCLKDEKN
jgi:hypothetical protein